MEQDNVWRQTLFLSQPQTSDKTFSFPRLRSLICFTPRAFTKQKISQGLLGDHLRVEDSWTITPTNVDSGRSLGIRRVYLDRLLLNKGQKSKKKK
ncbi:hypothetical protein CDAR_184711 [Caerostris darwini]|uniref:Uncharacterized protein n=1 Tax=Caerostris darwini TaxID=1538125 RepID=A0AAV4VXN0_9ARAC|nr:hypothetical protein CDAR_184711 [Caerostris darwini]